MNLLSYFNNKHVETIIDLIIFSSINKADTSGLDPEAVD